MFKKITLLSLLSSVIPVMGMKNERSQTTHQQKYSEEEYNNFINTNYLVAESKSTEFLQGFIRFIKKKTLSDQCLAFLKFMNVTTDSKRIVHFSDIVLQIRDELLKLPLETVLFSGLISTLVNLQAQTLRATYFSSLLKAFEKKANENTEKLSNLHRNCVSLFNELEQRNLFIKYESSSYILTSNYIFSCAFLNLKPSKALSERIPTVPLLTQKAPNELIIDRAREIHGEQEYNQLLEDVNVILITHPTLKVIEQNINKIKKYYNTLSYLREMSSKKINEQIDNLPNFLQQRQIDPDLFQQELLALHPLTLLENSACHELLITKLKNTDFEKTFQEASKLGVQGKLAEFCLNNTMRLPVNDWASYALAVLDSNEVMLINSIKKALKDKEKRERKKTNQHLKKPLEKEPSLNNDLLNEKELSEAPSSVPSLASSINTLEFGNRLDSFKQLYSKPTTQLSSEEKSAKFADEITLMYKNLEFTSDEDLQEYQRILYSSQNTFYNHAKAHTISADDAAKLRKIKALETKDALTEELDLEQLMENRSILTAFILPKSNASDDFIRYVQEQLLENSDRIDVAERSFEEKEGFYIGMRWKTKQPFNYVEFKKHQKGFLVKIKTGYHFTGALDEKGNPLTIYPVECSEESLVKEMSQLSLTEKENPSFKKKTYQEKK